MNDWWSWAEITVFLDSELPMGQRRSIGCQEQNLGGVFLMIPSVEEQHRTSVLRAATGPQTQTLTVGEFCNYRFQHPFTDLILCLLFNIRITC